MNEQEQSALKALLKGLSGVNKPIALLFQIAECWRLV